MARLRRGSKLATAELQPVQRDACGDGVAPPGLTTGRHSVSKRAESSTCSNTSNETIASKKRPWCRFRLTRPARQERPREGERVRGQAARWPGDQSRI
jgi:hypothetical protein